MEEEGLALTDPVTEEDPNSEVEAVGGLNMHPAQVMSCYQREEQQCFMCGLRAILPKAALTTRHLSDGVETKQIPKGLGKAALPLWVQQVPDLR